MQTLFNETFKNRIGSVNFISDKLNGFGKQMQELITSIKNIKEKKSNLERTK